MSTCGTPERPLGGSHAGAWERSLSVGQRVKPGLFLFRGGDGLRFLAALEMTLRCGWFGHAHPASLVRGSFPRSGVGMQPRTLQRPVISCGLNKSAWSVFGFFDFAFLVIFLALTCPPVGRLSVRWNDWLGFIGNDGSTRALFELDFAITDGINQLIYVSIIRISTLIGFEIFECPVFLTKR